jgi:hypothetical protein
MFCQLLHWNEHNMPKTSSPKGLLRHQEALQQQRGSAEFRRQMQDSRIASA